MKASLVKDFRRDAFFFPKNSEQKMLSSDVPVFQKRGLFGCVRLNAFALI
jgi:hypothetical protein